MRKNNKKRVYLKKWLENTLILINFILIMVIASIVEFTDIKTYLLITIISLIIITINGIILNKYSRLFIEK